MKLITELRQIADDYQGGTIELATGLEFSQYDVLRTVQFYSNSRYLNSETDSLGREKPFYNIVNTMVDTAVVATDIDTKDVRVQADNESSYDKAVLFNHEIQLWMKESNFAESLNKQGQIRARSGGVVVKKCMEEDEDGQSVLEIEPVDWKNLVTDQVDIEDGLIIEKHYMTPMEIRKKKGTWKNIEEAISLYNKKGHTRVDERIEVWEVHGELPDGYLSEDGDSEDKDTYSQQVHFYAVKNSKNTHLYWAKEDESPYRYLPWKPREGAALGIGVVEEGIQSQVWTNDAIQKEQAAIELSSRIILKTNSKKVGSNVLTDLDNGSVITLEDGKELEVLNLMTGALPQFQNLVDKWWSQYERVTSSYDAVRGETPPSGQPYRLQALVSQTGSSHFDYRREEWGIFLTEIFYDWVFPYLEKRINKAHILASDFTPEELQRIDKSFAIANAESVMVEQILNGNLPFPEDYQSEFDKNLQQIAQSGQRRFLDIPKNYYKDMESHLTIDITGEQRNKQATMDSLNTMLQTMVPLTQMGIVTPQDVQKILNRIIEISGSGISPISLNHAQAQQQAQMAQQTQTQGPLQQQMQSQASPIGASPLPAKSPMAQ